MHLFSIWTIGPSAVGKTTVSKIFYNQLKIKNDKLILLDGDKIRNMIPSQEVKILLDILI